MGLTQGHIFINRLVSNIQREGLYRTAALGLRFIYCWLYKHKLQSADSLLIRGSFVIRGGKSIRIGSLRAGARIQIEAIQGYKSQSFRPKIVIGHRVFLSNDVHIGCTNSVVIGNDVLIGSHVFISDHDHGIYAGGTPNSHPDQPPADRLLTSDGQVVLEDNVHIGEYVSILKNVRIGSGSIIGSQSVVTRDIPPSTIAAGNPARPIKKFDPASGRWVPYCESHS